MIAASRLRCIGAMHNAEEAALVLVLQNPTTLSAEGNFRCKLQQQQPASQPFSRTFGCPATTRGRYRLMCVIPGTCLIQFTLTHFPIQAGLLPAVDRNFSLFTQTQNAKAPKTGGCVNRSTTQKTPPIPAVPESELARTHPLLVRRRFLGFAL